MKTMYLVPADAYDNPSKSPPVSPNWWKLMRLYPILSLPRYDQILYDPATKKIDITKWVDYIVSSLNPLGVGTDWAANFWCTDNLNGKCFVGTWDQKEYVDIFLERLGWLVNAAQNKGMTKVIMDLEYYPATPGGSGGLMNPKFPKTPWPLSITAEHVEGLGSVVLGTKDPVINNFVRDMVGVLGPGVGFGGYVTSTEVKKFPAMALFLAGIGKEYAKSPNNQLVLMGEDFNNVKDESAATLVHATYFHGFRGSLKAARSVKNSWIWDPDKVILRKVPTPR